MSRVLRTSEFQKEVINGEGVVLVDFFAEWCGPCKMLAPTLDTLSREMAGRARIYKVDIDQCADLAMKYGIMSVPTMMIFKDGRAVEKVVGFQPKDKLRIKLENHI